MVNDYNVLAKHIVSKYVERISGSDIEERIVGEEPSKRVMVGMLAEDRVNQTFAGAYAENGATKFESIPSITMSFIIKKFAKGKIRIIPQGLFFYSVQPEYDEVIKYVLDKYSIQDKISYASVHELIEKYPDVRFLLPSVYKKMDIAKAMGSGIELEVSSIKAGTKSFEDEISEKLMVLEESISNEIRIMPEMQISFLDLESKAKFDTICKAKEQRVNPKWVIDIVCRISEQADNYYISLQMVNKTVLGTYKNIGYIPKIFNAGIRVIGEGTAFEEIPLDYFKRSYKEREAVYAIAENTSVKYIKETNELITENIPIYFQHRLKTRDKYNAYITFEKMIDSPVMYLKKLLAEMKKDYIKCEKEFERRTSSEATCVHKEAASADSKCPLYGQQRLTRSAEKKFKDALNDYWIEISRFENGIQHIEYKDYVKKAFICMNKTFQLKLEGEHRQISGWRMFQIVFIVSLIGEIIKSEYKDDPTLREADIAIANLLYFPTGGGKTEAFLGACVFTMFFDRFRGKNGGVSAILKYPLRLLAVQQLERVLIITMKANIIRRQERLLANTNAFQVGFYVGSNNTPNKITDMENLSSRGSINKNQGRILDCDQETLNEYYRFIDTCPICGKKKINIVFNRALWKLEHVCKNENCSVKALPLLIVDNEIYRYMPSIIVSTIDKMAMIGISNEFKMIMGQARKYCPVHGYSSGTKCICGDKSCDAQLFHVSLKDPVPTLYIQDEMHLVKESLGTFDSHYESFLNYYAKYLVPKEQRKQLRFVGATATISMYKEHIRHLYHMEGRRFPCEYPSIEAGKDFYSYTDKQDITRILLGYAPYGRSVTNGMWESVYIMRLVIYALFANIHTTYAELAKKGFSKTEEELKNMLYDYWIELVYNNRKQDATELENAFQNQGNNLLEARKIPLFHIEQMTSDTDFQTVRKTLFDIQANRKNMDSTNLILATSTISHGVDEDSFNIMYFFGMPNNNAEYIQAYSRTGRKYTGIVIDMIRSMRVRDRSYLKNFVIFHQNKDDLVESVPINTWAKNAIYSTFPGLLAGLFHQYYTMLLNEENLYNASRVKKLLIEERICEQEVIDHMIGIYGCNPSEKLSLAYEEIIRKEVHHILWGIRTGNFLKDETLSNAIAKFSHGKKSPMRSLRDTEEQVEIKI